MRLGLFWRKAGRSSSLEKLRSPFFFELLAKLTDAISCTQSTLLCMAMDMEESALTCIAGITADRLRRRSVDELQTIVMESFLVEFSQTIHPCLANDNTFCNRVFRIKIGQKLISNKARKDDLVTIDRKRLIEAQRVKKSTGLIFT